MVLVVAVVMEEVEVLVLVGKIAVVKKVVFVVAAAAETMTDKELFELVETMVVGAAVELAVVPLIQVSLLCQQLLSLTHLYFYLAQHLLQNKMMPFAA